MESTSTKRKTVTSKAVKNRYETKRTQRLNKIAQQFGFDSWRLLSTDVIDGRATITVTKLSDSGVIPPGAMLE